MRLSRLAVLAAAAAAPLILAEPAMAAPLDAAPDEAALNAPPENPTLVIHIDKSTQTMTVTVDGIDRYVWPVSTGRPGYNTPSGSFKPFRMDIDHVSEKYDNAPMPHSIFFTMYGDAVHGTLEEKNLGLAVSHGCVRLSLKNAATLWELVKRQKMANTEVVLTGQIPAGAAVARAAPPDVNRRARLGAPPEPAHYVERDPRFAGAYDETPPPRYYETRPAPPSPSSVSMW